MGAKINSLPFLTAKIRLKSRYGIDMESDAFIEKAYYIWRSIGNIAKNDITVKVKVPENNIITLPSNCEFIDSIHTEGSYTNYSGFNSNGATVGYSTPRVDYKILSKNSVKILSKGLISETLVVEYSAIAKDDDGLPVLNDLEVDAIAATLALQETEIDLFRHVAGAENIIKYIKPEAERLMLAAKGDEQLSSDDLDRLLDAKTSWNMKTYGDRFNFNR